MKYKVVATDFDGTFLTSDKKISKETKNIFDKLKKEGAVMVGVTARNFSSVNDVCDPKEYFDYLILNNGTYIYDVKNSKGIYFGFLNENISKKIVDGVKESVKQIDICCTNFYYKYNCDYPKMKKYWKRINDIDEIKETIVRMNIFPFSNEELDKIRKFLDNNFTEIETFYMQDTDIGNDKIWIGVVPKGVNKFTCLEKLCNDLSISTNEVIFFGDSGNDAQIIEKVGLGVAMGNAVLEVKQKAKAITLSNDENGIAEFLENKLEDFI